MVASRHFMEQEICKSLNCPQCDHPYSKTADGDHVPTQTYCRDTQAMCMECYQTCQDNESVRIHQCNGMNCFRYKTLPAYYLMAMCMKCYQTCQNNESVRKQQCYLWNCFVYKTLPAYYLMEFLSNGCFVLNEEKNIYLMVSQSIQFPECPYCLEEYSIENPQREPFALRCGHSICNGCFDGMKSGTVFSLFSHALKCPQCKDRRSYAQTSWENPLKAFLRELPTKQMELAEKEAQSKQTVLNRNCDDCEEETPLIKMFRCNDCGDKTMKELKEEILSTINPQITAYDVSFPQLQDDLTKNIEIFQKSLFNEVGQIETLHFDQATEQSKDSLVIGEKFEELSEKYLMELRLCNTGIEKLIDGMSGKWKENE